MIVAAKMSSMTGPVEVVRSKTNACLKRAGAILAGKEDALLLEGERLVADAIAGGHPLELLLVAEDRPELAGRFEAADVRLVEPRLLERVSAMTHSPGVLAIAARPARQRLADLELAGDSVILVAAGVADPGNLGALARGAEAAGAAALVVLAGGARPFTAKALRGSMGSLLRLPVVEEPEAVGLVEELNVLGVRSVACATRAGVSWREFDWSGRIALWAGAETGVMPEVAAGFESVSIPMAGGVESLNVTVAASLLLFEAKRTG